MENSVFRTSSDCKKYIDGNFSVLTSIITSVCKKLYHIVSDCEECVSDLLLKIVENDYEILRSFPGGKDYKFATYLFTVLYRKAYDIVRIKKGHYRPSTKAKKLGRCTVELEKQLFYGSTLQEAHQTMLNIEECKNITFDDAQKIENEIRRKTGKPKPTTEYVSDINTLYGESSDEYPDITTGKPLNEHLVDGVHNKDPLENFEEEEGNEVRKQFQKIMASFMDKLKGEDLIIFNMSFFKSVNVSQIARSINQERYFVATKIEELVEDFKELLIKNDLSLEDLKNNYNF